MKESYNACVIDSDSESYTQTVQEAMEEISVMVAPYITNLESPLEDFLAFRKTDSGE